MSNYAWIALGAGAATFLLVLWLIFRESRVEPKAAPPADSPWYRSIAAQEWQEKADAARGDFGLKPIRDVASTWTGSIAALLGVLSAVAFVAGPTDLVKDVGGWEAELAAWLVLAAAAVAAVSLTYAIMAEQGYPQWSDDLTGWDYRSLTEQRAKKSADQLRNSRYGVLLALLLIIVATGIAWMTPLTKDTTPNSQSAIVTSAEGAMCGTLESKTDGVLNLKTEGISTPIPSTAQITLVDDCPSAK